MTSLTEVAASIEAATETVRTIRAARQRAHLTGEIGALTGYRIVLDPNLADGTVHLYRPTHTMTIGTRPLTALELARHEARHIVRSGLADWLEWLGEDVGPAKPVTHQQLLDVLGVTA